MLTLKAKINYGTGGVWNGKAGSTPEVAHPAINQLPHGTSEIVPE